MTRWQLVARVIEPAHAGKSPNEYGIENRPIGRRRGILWTRLRTAARTSGSRSSSTTQRARSHRWASSTQCGASAASFPNRAHSAADEDGAGVGDSVPSRKTTVHRIGRGAGCRCPQAGCQSSIRLPSGSVTHPKRPKPSCSWMSSSTSAPLARSWSSIAPRSRTRKLSMVCWERDPK